MHIEFWGQKEAKFGKVLIMRLIGVQPDVIYGKYDWIPSLMDIIVCEQLDDLEFVDVGCKWKTLIEGLTCMKYMKAWVKNVFKWVCMLEWRSEREL